jgi:N-acetylneuraminic acid mutarotase
MNYVHAKSLRILEPLVLVMLVLILVGITIPAQGQISTSPDDGSPLTIVHNTWSSGAPMPTAVMDDQAVGVLKGQMYVVGGTSSTGIIANTQIYNPTTNTWSAGTSLPTTIAAASAAVVNSVLYVFGGTSDGVTATNAVWAYNPTTKTWTGKAAMPTARWATAAVVENKIVYVMGGAVNGNGNGFVATVESYNPATNTWTEEAPMLVAKGQPAAGLIGTTLAGFTIVVADGVINGSTATGDNEGYNATTNTWRTLAADPTARFASCFGSIGQKFYDVAGQPAPTVTEMFRLSTNKWTTTLAPVPQSTIFPGSAVYKGKLYCFGGWASWLGNIINNVQIYQP